MSKEKGVYASSMGRHSETGLVENILKGLTVRKVIVVVLVVVLLRATWAMLRNIIFEPEPMILSETELHGDEFGMKGFKPQSCVMVNGVCKPFSEADVPIPSKGLYAHGDNFYLDGRPFKIFSGSFHYFRTHPAQWGDRLLRMKASGLNTVMIYIPWNMHEKRKGEFTYGGIYDLSNFIQQVQKVGLYLIVRPGPYICAEWEYGGLPSWLLHDPLLKVRTSSYWPYLKHVEDYFSKLFPLLSKSTYKRGGPIIAFQVENEFGSFGHDPDYLKFIVKQFDKWQLDELLFTSDGDKQLPNGTLPNILATVNFAKDPEGRLTTLKKFQPGKPMMVTEFWSGWFDHWGEKHHTFEASELRETLDKILSMNASVNFYMFMGGTNFEFWNGANYLGADDNHKGSLLGPTITSYDYDAPVSECGDITPKFKVIRELLSKHSLYPLDIPDIPPNPVKKAYGKVAITEYMGLYDMLEHVPEKPLTYKDPMYMEMLPINNDGGQGYGWILYRSKFAQTKSLFIEADVLDRAQVLVNGREITALSYWDYASRQFNISLKDTKLLSSKNGLDLLVENMGRINYERVSYNKPLLSTQRKGFQGKVRTAEGQVLTDWEHIPIEFCNVFKENLKTSRKWHPLSTPPGLEGMPTLYRATLTIDSQSPQDTFLDMGNWSKGLVLVNGFNLGRYWMVGPQRTLYVPAPVLMQGKNEIIVFDLESKAKDMSVELIDQPLLAA